jgi:hypothetical protein
MWIAENDETPVNRAPGGRILERAFFIPHSAFRIPH